MSRETYVVFAALVTMYYFGVWTGRENERALYRFECDDCYARFLGLAEYDTHRVSPCSLEEYR